jgi:nucleoid-associated protein YgaU
MPVLLIMIRRLNMEKEAKVGLAVILVLLIIFGGVVAKRIYDSRTTQPVLVAGDEDNGQFEKPSNVKKDISDKVTDKRDESKTATISTGQPIVVAAISTFDKPPLSGISGVDQAGVGFESSKEKISTVGVSEPKSPPSFMPVPLKSGEENPADRYSTGRRSASSQPPQKTVDNDEVSNDAMAEVRHGSSPEHLDPFAKVNAASTSANDTESSDTSTVVTATVGPDESQRNIGQHLTEQNSSEDPKVALASNRYDSYQSEREDPFTRDVNNDLRQAGSSSSVSSEIRQTGISSNRTGSRRIYTVVSGDSLYDIARGELGKASRWVEIYELNKDVLSGDLDSLVPGTQIVLPEEKLQNSSSLARRPGTEYRQ